MLAKPRTSLLLILTLISGFLLLSPQHNYQQLLSQGDHGRDLYAFDVAYQGEAVYHDYWWVYGPLMPYYYGLFDNALGVSIESVQWGKIVLLLIGGLFLFLLLEMVIPPLFAFLGALWFWTFQPDFFFTYNHIGGVTVCLAIAYALGRYIQDRDARAPLWALAGVVVLSFIKVNFGFSALAAVLATVFVTDRTSPDKRHSPRFYLLAGLLLPAGIIGCYALLVAGMPIHEIRQCLPYISSDRPHNLSPVIALWMWWNAIAVNIMISWPNRLFAILVIYGLTRTAYLWGRRNLPEPGRTRLGLTILMIALFYAVNFHEYIVSGVTYRAYWSTPFSTCLMFILIATALKKDAGRLVQVLVVLGLFLIVDQNFRGTTQLIDARMRDGHYLALERGRVATENDPVWFDTVYRTVNYLETHLSKDETFFALPYDTLYHYLTAKKSPSRQLIFFEHINIPPQQEQDIIKELEDQKVNYVLLSSRMNALTEEGLGVFGQTYCPLLAKYVFENFEPVAQFGDWQNPPGWAWHHGTLIMKRKGSATR